MRLLYVVRSANPNGGGVIEAINQFTAAHKKQGHTIEIASLDPPGVSWLPTLPEPVRTLGWSDHGYGYSPGFTAWLRRTRRSYDAVIVNGLWQYSSFAVWRALSGSDIPYVVFPHGMLDPWFKHNYPLKHLKKTFYWWLIEHRVLCKALLVLFTCEEERQLARLSFHPYRCREAIANLGIAAPSGDAERQRAAFYASFPSIEGMRIFLFLGRLHEKKGCDILIKAFAQVRSRFDQKNQQIHLVVAGPCADPKYHTALKTLIASCFPGEKAPVTLTGMLSGEIKWGAYRSAEAFLLPSHQENFGFSVVEALACELPVLISDKVNIWREIAQDRAGLVAADNLGGVIQLLNEWLSMESASRRAMSRSARFCFLSRFEIAHASEQFIELLRSVKSSSSGKSTVGEQLGRPSSEIRPKE